MNGNFGKTGKSVRKSASSSSYVTAQTPPYYGGPVVFNIERRFTLFIKPNGRNVARDDSQSFSFFDHPFSPQVTATTFASVMCHMTLPTAGLIDKVMFFNDGVLFSL